MSGSKGRYLKVKDANRAYYYRNRAKVSAKRVEWAKARYYLIAEKYGGACACGSKDFKLENLNPTAYGLKGAKLHKWIIDNHFPKGFRLRCAECVKSQRTSNSEQAKRRRANRTPAQIAKEKQDNLKACAAYRKNHPDRRATLKRNRRAAKLSTGIVTSDDWKFVQDLAANKCLKCGRRRKLTMDHIIPLVEQGPHDIGNIQPLCHSCNCAKNTTRTDYRTDEMKRQIEQRRGTES